MGGRKPRSVRVASRRNGNGDRFCTAGIASDATSQGRLPSSCVDWKRIAPSKVEYQWVGGRSAYELAYAWCGGEAPRSPPELTMLFESGDETGALLIDEVLPEHRSGSILMVESRGMLLDGRGIRDLRRL